MKTLFLLIMLAMGSAAIAQPAVFQAPNSVFTRVIDTGAGLATLTIVTGDQASHRHVMVYDAGNSIGAVSNELKEYLLTDEKVDLMIISHGDTDHLKAAKYILENYDVDTVVRTGYQRTTSPSKLLKNWTNYIAKVREQAQDGKIKDIDLTKSNLAPGTVWSLGDASVTVLEGRGAAPASWNMHSESHELNSISVVVKLTYDGKSILFAGDTYGRDIRDPEDALKAAEKDMVARDGTIPLKSDILIAGHHGADNASAKGFVEKVVPTIVILAAGKKHGHPIKDTVRRINDAVEPDPTYYRTDRGQKSLTAMSGPADGTRLAKTRQVTTVFRGTW